MPRRSVSLNTCLALLSCALVGCMSNASRPASTPTKPASVPVSPSATPIAGVTVRNRSSSPTQTDAPGIQVKPPNVIPITMGNDSFSITADDWNTITEASNVPHDVVLGLDPDFHASPTTRNRFQYLADVMFKYAPPGFDTVGVGAVPVGGNVVTVVALINNDGNASKVTELNTTVTVGPPTTTIGMGSFYTAADAALAVAPHSIYFARLTMPLTNTPPTISAPNKTTNWDFHYSLEDCGGPTCPS